MIDLMDLPRKKEDSPVSNGGRGLKQPTRRSASLCPRFARQQWRAWIETTPRRAKLSRRPDSPVSNGGRGLKRHHLYALLDLAQAAGVDGVDGEVGSCHRSNSYNQKTSSDEVPAPGPPLPTFGRTQHVAPCWVIYCLRYRRTPTRQSSALWDWPWKVVTPVQPSTPVSNTSSAGVSCPSTENCAT